MRTALTIVACVNPAAAVTCAPTVVALSAGATLAVGGSIADALQAAAISYASMHIWAFVGDQLGAIAANLNAVGKAATAAGRATFAAVKGAVHGVVGGALSVAQGGSFREGFIANSIGAAAGVAAEIPFGVAGTGGDGATIARTAVAAAAGGTASQLTGGKFGNGALTAAMAHLFNAECVMCRGQPLLEDGGSRVGVAHSGVRIAHDPGREAADTILNYGSWVVGGSIVARYSGRLANGARRLSFDGPTKGLWYGNGRVFQIRYRKSPAFRVDFQAYKGSGAKSRLHLHFAPNMNKHYSIDPRSIFDR